VVAEEEGFRIQFTTKCLVWISYILTFSILIFPLLRFGILILIPRSPYCKKISECHYHTNYLFNPRKIIPFLPFIFMDSRFQICSDPSASECIEALVHVPGMYIHITQEREISHLDLTSSIPFLSSSILLLVIHSLHSYWRLMQERNHTTGIQINVKCSNEIAEAWFESLSRIHDLRL